MPGVLINENLPVRLAALLRTEGIGAVHISECGLNGRPDREIWAYAINQDLAVMTKDSDYIDLALSEQEGQVVLVSTGNLRLRELLEHVSSKSAAIQDFLQSNERFASL